MEEPFYIGGQEVAKRTRYNDRLLMFLPRNRAPERFGHSLTKDGGSMKGLNAVGKMEKRRLKKKWRKEWEEERRNISPAEVRASIDAKIEALRTQLKAERAREWAEMSEETREAWARFEELRNRDFERLAADKARRLRHEHGPREDVTYPPPPKREPEPPKPRKTVHTLKDDGWEADGWQ